MIGASITRKASKISEAAKQAKTSPIVEDINLELDKSREIGQELRLKDLETKKDTNSVTRSSQK